EYCERLDQYFIANDLVDKPEKQRAILITCIGGESYSLLRNICAPVTPASKSYAELIKLMKEHLSPKPLVIAERFHFHMRTQGDKESVAQFVALLKSLTEFCDFAAFRKDALRDRLVCGLRSTAIQK